MVHLTFFTFALLSITLINFIDKSVCLNKKDECTKLLDELSASQGSFVQCATQHSVPVKLCTVCGDKHMLMSIQFANLVNNTVCKARYFDNDRINIITTTQSILNGLWTKAYCADCQNTNHSSEFDELHANWSACVDQKYSDICNKCLEMYVEVNTFYRNIEKETNGKVCFEIQDAMNRTRSHWSKDLKCCQREVHLTLFILATSIIALLPLIFYGSAYVLTKRSERNHGLLNEQEPGLEQPSTTSLISAAIIATSPATSTPPSLKATDFANGSTVGYSSLSDSDDDMIATRKKLKNKMLSET